MFFFSPGFTPLTQKAPHGLAQDPQCMHRLVVVILLSKYILGCSSKQSRALTRISSAPHTLHTQFTKETESALAQTNIPTANIIFTNIILMADKHNIPKGKMPSNCRLLSEDIVCKITQRNNIRRANTCDPALKLLNKEITSDIQKHKQNIWKEHAHWDHRHNTHTLLKTIHGLSNSAPPHTLNTSITFNNKIATTRNTQNKQPH